MNRTMRMLAIAVSVGLGAGVARAQDAVPVSEPAEARRPATAPVTGVPVRDVVLYSSGVGYFEHFGSVQGNESTELRFKTAQINDILKSLVLQDLDGGHVTTITYPSQDPISKQLKSFQVDIAGNPSLAELLNQLRGAKLRVEWAAEKLEGTILGVESKPRAVGETSIQVWVLNIISGATLRAVPLEEVRRLEFTDPQLQQELEKALEALAQARDQDKKPVSIQFVGDGERRVRIGYVVETPVWKTSYRLLLADGDNAPRLQGWAIVENQTDNDWNDVQLSLVSGRPISFVQDLYQPLYVPRPVVEPELYASLRPERYEAGVGGDEMLNLLQKQVLDRRREAAPASTNAPRASLMEAAERLSSNQDSDFASSVASIASVAQVGELFQYTVGNVSLPRQKSAMIPIITDEVEVERLSIYNARVMPRHPLNGARLKNTTEKHLLQGPITVFDGGGYAGDAQINNVPPGQERLVSFGVDLQTLVDATDVKSNSAVVTGKIVKGVLELSFSDEFRQVYSVENKSPKDKTLIIEHPRDARGGWELRDTADPVETTDALYRFKLPVAAGKTESFPVQLRKVRAQTLALLPADVGQILVYARSGAIPQEVRDVLLRAIEMKNAMTDLTRRINERAQRMEAISTGQNRIRENMRTIDRNSDYYNRLLTKLNEEETQLENLQHETEALKKQRDVKQAELEAFLSGANVG